MDFTCRCGEPVYETGVNRRSIKNGRLHYDGIEKRYVCPEPVPARVIDQQTSFIPALGRARRFFRRLGI